MFYICNKNGDNDFKEINLWSRLELKCSVKIASSWGMIKRKLSKTSYVSEIHCLNIW